MKRYFIISLMLLTGLLAARQYTLDDFIKAAINNSYSIRQKEILRQNADLNVGIAGWNLLPSADISSARTNQDGNYRNKASLEIARSISLNEPSVFDLYQAKLDKDIAELDWQQTRKETIYSIYSAWIDIAQIQKEVAIRTENLKVLRKIKEQAELQKSLGQRTTYDVKQADINVINAELSIFELQNQLAKLRADLFNKVKLNDEGGELVFDKSDAIKSPDFSQPSEEPLLLAQLRQDIRKSRLDKLQQKIGLFPALTFSARYVRHNKTVDLLDFGKYDDSYTLSMGVSWSLWTPFTGAKSYSRINNTLFLKQWQYEENLAAQKLDNDNLKREWLYLNDILNLNRKKSAQAADNLLIAQERYNLGTLSLIELEQARINALEAELSVNKISFQLQKKLQEWNLKNSQLILDKY